MSKITVLLNREQDGCVIAMLDELVITDERLDSDELTRAIHEILDQFFDVEE